jgi:hypothetical protein
MKAPWFALPVEGASMKRVNQHDFYQLGLAVHPLTEIAKDSTVGQNYFNLTTAKSWLGLLLADRMLPLRVAKQACNALHTAIVPLVPDNINVEAFKNKLTPVQVFRVQRAAKEFETVLAAETQTFDTYFVDQKGAYFHYRSH